MLDNFTPSETSRYRWEYHRDYLKYTTCPDVIIEEAAKVRDGHIWIELLSKGYRSSPTLILEAGKGGLEIDRPENWKDDIGPMIIRYRPPKRPWHILKTRVKTSTSNGIFTPVPDVIVVVEKREYFRVSCPLGSRIILMKRIKCGEKTRLMPSVTGKIRDISLGGLAFYLDDPRRMTPPPLRSIVGPFTVELMLTAEKPWNSLLFSEAEVIRIREAGRYDKRSFEVALKFRISSKEKERLYPYIQKRELELLKTGALRE